MQKIFLGLVGPSGAGKETFVEHLTTIVSPCRVGHLSTSGFLAEILTMCGVERTVINLQTLAIKLEEGFGVGTLTRALKRKMDTVEADIVCYNCIRWQSDYELIRSLPDNLVVAVSAPIETRWERTKKRGEKLGEADATFERFCVAAKRETEREIVRLASLADYTIDNSGTKEGFGKSVRMFVQLHLPRVIAHR